MTYKTILVHADHSRHAAERIRIAANIALAENAHLIGVAVTGLSRYAYPDRDIDSTGMFVAAHLQALHESARLALVAFESIAGSLGVSSVEARLVDDDAGSALSLQARYCDLVVISQTDLSDPVSRLSPDLPEYVMLHCARPILVIPYTGRIEKIGINVMVAWDGSKEATHAISGAIPMLRRAERATVVVFNPESHYDAHGEQPGADIALYLARQNVKVDVIQQIVDFDIGDALLSLSADLGSDLLVAGGYGHTRFREIMMGGVTRTLLKSMTIPVLMAH